LECARPEHDKAALSEAFQLALAKPDFGAAFVLGATLESWLDPYLQIEGTPHRQWALTGAMKTLPCGVARYLWRANLAAPLRRIWLSIARTKANIRAAGIHTTCFAYEGNCLTCGAHCPDSVGF
jgi:hypothetical protein